MSHGADERVGTNHHVISYVDLPDVENGEVEITGEVITDEYVLSAVASEGLGNPYILAHGAQHLLQEIILRLIVCAVDGVELLTPSDGTAFPANQFLVSDSPIAEADLQEMKDFYAVLDKGLHTETYGGNTCLKEWADLTLNSQGDASNHRHLSHLMALFPYGQVSAFSSDPQEKQLYKAAVNSLHVRNSTDVTGWSASWKINLHARALEGDAAHRIFPQMLKHSGSYQIVMSGQGGCYYNLWDSHSPFQIDGNFGYTSGVAEMLLQSYDGQIHLLPALPSVWKNGHVKGLKAVGDFTVDQEWADGAFAGATITNNQGQPLSFTVGCLPEGKTVEATVNDVATGIQRNDDGSFAIPSSSAGDVVRINVIDKALVGIRQPHAYAPSSTTYNLSGIPVNDSFHGLVIQDHKVVLRR